MSDNKLKTLLNLFVPRERIKFGKNEILFKKYPFRDSIAYQKGIIHATDIENIDIHSFPPQIKVNKELLFIPAQQKAELEKFATENNIKLVKRVDLWSYILEPFLDTEFDDKHYETIYKMLQEYNLEKKFVDELRARVKKPMIAFNAVHWEWINLNAYDVLTAMRPTLSKEEFTKFYAEVMEIALIPDKYQVQP